jgi:hypothetical protein
MKAMVAILEDAYSRDFAQRPISRRLAAASK